MKFNLYPRNNKVPYSTWFKIWKINNKVVWFIVCNEYEYSVSVHFGQNVHKHFNINIRMVNNGFQIQLLTKGQIHRIA